MVKHIIFSSFKHPATCLGLGFNQEYYFLSHFCRYLHTLVRLPPSGLSSLLGAITTKGFIPIHLFSYFDRITGERCSNLNL